MALVFEMHPIDFRPLHIDRNERPIHFSCRRNGAPTLGLGPRQPPSVPFGPRPSPSVPVSPSSAALSRRQPPSASVNCRQSASATVSPRQRPSAGVSLRQLRSSVVSLRQPSSAALGWRVKARGQGLINPQLHQGVVSFRLDNRCRYDRPALMILLPSPCQSWRVPAGGGWQEVLC